MLRAGGAAGPREFGAAGLLPRGFGLGLGRPGIKLDGTWLLLSGPPRPPGTKAGGGS